MNKEIITTEKAPAAIGPYSQAVKTGDMIYTSGMLPIIPETGQIVEGDAAAQADQVMKNVSALLKSQTSSLDQVIKTTLFIKDMNDFGAINEVYKKYFTQDFPARSCVEVARLPKDVFVEMECIALVQRRD